MNVDVFRVESDLALRKLEEYKTVSERKRLEEDRDLQKVWQYASQYPLLDVALALREAGLNERYQPRLALARATWERCYFSRRRNAFSSSARYWGKQYAVRLPEGTYPNTRWVDCFTDVPHIPPNIRPNDALSRYHILFEVENWQEYPTDPFLLRHVSGWIYAVIGEWDLTPFEASILAGLKTRA